MSLGRDIKASFGKKCPACGSGKLFKSSYSLEVVENCEHCGLDLSEHDAGDGTAVFFTFILGFLFVPIALVLDHMYGLSLWVQALLWSVIGLGIIAGLMPPVKAYIIALNYRHRMRHSKEDV